MDSRTRSVYPEMPALTVTRTFPVKMLRIKIPTHETCEKCKYRFEIDDNVVDYFNICNQCIREIKIRNLHKCSACCEYKLLKRFSSVCVDC